ncbi:hypothetical protein [Saccharopolyspora taberi]|uniref:Uncharacterized protein n=1 Tax=Saccharopolyspora taberi TaxID=60895 RepID=A0ABN3V0V5_9PSEU
MHEFYGIDVDSGVLRTRSWRWLRARIVGLLSCESRLARALTPPDTDAEKAARKAARR